MLQNKKIQNNKMIIIHDFFNKNDNRMNYRQILIDDQIINEKINLRNCSNRNEILFKNENL